MNSLEFLCVFVLVTHCIFFGHSNDVSFSLCWLKDNSMQRQNGNVWLNLTSLKSIGSLGKVVSVTVPPLVENKLRLHYGGEIHEWNLTIILQTQFIKVRGRHKPSGIPTNTTTNFLKTLISPEVFACENGTLFFYQDEQFFFAVGHTMRLPVMLGSRSPSMLQVSWVVTQQDVFHNHRLRLYQAQLGSFNTLRTSATVLNHHNFFALDSCSSYIICVEIGVSHSIICISTITDPDIPVNFKMSSWKSSSISLAWDCPINRRYSLFLLSAFYLNGTDYITEEQTMWIRDDVFTFTLSDLQPCSRVKFGLQTVCQAGIETRYSNMVMSNGSSGHSNIKSLRQTSFGPDFYTLGWDVATISSISMFRVYHEGLLQGTTLTTTYTVRGLLPCLEYQARVEALCGESVVMNSRTWAAHTGPEGVSELRYHSNDSTVSWTPSSAQKSALTFIYQLSTGGGLPFQSSRITTTQIHLTGLVVGEPYVLSLWEECNNQYKSEAVHLSFQGVNSSVIQTRAARPTHGQGTDLGFESIGLHMVLPWTLPIELQDDVSEPTAKMKEIFKEKMQHELLNGFSLPVHVELASIKSAGKQNKTYIEFVFFDDAESEDKVVLPVKEQVDYIHSLKNPNISVKDGVIYWDGPDLCASEHNCPSQSLCINTLDSFTCVCRHGYYDVTSAIKAPAASQPLCKENGLFSQCRSKLMTGGVAKPYLTSQIGGKVEVKLNDGRCKMNESDTLLFFRMSRSVSECGTEKQVNKTHIKFRNTLTVILTKEKTISRRDLKVVWKCVYPRHYVRNAQVSVDMDWFSSISLVEFNSSLQLGLSMTLHTDETYNTSYTESIYLGPFDTLFFEVAIKTNVYFLLNLILQVDSCWATESSDPKDSVQAVFLLKGCPTDTTFQWHMANDLEMRSRFSIQLFTMPEGLPLYFHCLTNICGRDENCTEECRSEVRRRRAVIQEDRRDRRGAVVSVGPLFLTASKTLVQPSHMTNHMNILYTVAAVMGFLGIIMLSVIATKAIMMYYEHLPLE